MSNYFSPIDKEGDGMMIKLSQCTAELTITTTISTTTTTTSTTTEETPTAEDSEGKMFIVEGIVYDEKWDEEVEFKMTGREEDLYKDKYVLSAMLSVL